MVLNNFPFMPCRSADAEAEPTADAEAGYYGGYYSYPAYGYGHRAYGYGYPYAGYGYHYGKRSADAEPQFLAAPYAFGAYGNGAFGNGAYGYAPFVRPAVAASHAVVSTPAFTYGMHQLHKRDAEAKPEAEADAEAYYYGGYPAYAYGHRAYGYGAYGYGHRAYGYGYPYAYGRYYY